jgi:hypothetical protein
MLILGPDTHPRKDESFEASRERCEERFSHSLSKSTSSDCLPGTRIAPRYAAGEDAAPSERGFEALLEACLRFDVTAAMVFTCRDGVTRTSTGMVVGCLVWRVRNGELPEFLSQLDPSHPNYEQAEFKPVIRIVHALGQLGLQVGGCTRRIQLTRSA